MRKFRKRKRKKKNRNLRKTDRREETSKHNEELQQDTETN
jgi:hypothetical protein